MKKFILPFIIVIITNYGLKAQTYCLQCTGSLAGNRATSIGNRTSASGDNSFAGGSYSVAAILNSFAFGDSAIVAGASSGFVPITNTNSFALGYKAYTNNSYSFSIGNLTQALAANSFAIGNSTVTSGSSSFAFGNNSTASAANNMAIGNYTSVTANNAMVIGMGLPSNLLTNGTQNSIMLGVYGTPSISIVKSNGDSNTPQPAFVGVGTTNPLSTLHVNGNVLVSAGSLSLMATASDNNSWNINREANKLTINKVQQSGGTENVLNAITFMDNGNIGIGNGNPQKKLEVTGDVSITNRMNSKSLYILDTIRMGSNQESYWNINQFSGGLKISYFSNFAFKGGNNTEAFQNTAFVIKYNSGAVGIGTENPTAMLEVIGSTKTENIIVTTLASSANKLLRIGANGQFAAGSVFESADGKIGIGTDTPFTKLQLGSIWTFHDGTIDKIIGRNCYYNGTNNVRIQQGYASRMYFNNTGGIVFETANTGNENTVITAWNGMYLNNNGSLGIGTSTIPDTYKLAVKGKVICEDLLVELHADWPDYVFSDEYKLRSLPETEQYIKENKHLPDVPSAKQIEKTGLDVAEMNKILIQKLEEITLYVIEQDKQIFELNNKIKKLENIAENEK